MIANQIITVSSVRRQQTVITFDNGATWQKIAAPANINGAATNCVLVRTKCIKVNLHHLQSDSANIKYNLPAYT